MWEEGKENSAREQKLMISAFYGVGLELARLKVPQPSILNSQSHTLHLGTEVILLLCTPILTSVPTHINTSIILDVTMASMIPTRTPTYISFDGE